MGHDVCATPVGSGAAALGHLPRTLGDVAPPLDTLRAFLALHACPLLWLAHGRNSATHAVTTRLPERILGFCFFWLVMCARLRQGAHAVTTRMLEQVPCSSRVGVASSFVPLRCRRPDRERRCAYPLEAPWRWIKDSRPAPSPCRPATPNDTSRTGLVTNRGRGHEPRHFLRRSSHTPVSVSYSAALLIPNSM
jgi:hypothetical protein